MGLVQAKIESSIETSPQLIESLHMAREVALKSDVAEVLPAHLVLAMLEDDESSFLLDAYGVDFNKIRTQLGKIVQKQVKPKSPDRHAVFSSGIEAIMQHAREQAQKNALAEVDSNLILAVILSEKAGFMGALLAPYDLDTSGVLQYLELREGKTVNIDPLPSQKIANRQNPANHPEKNAQRPSPAPQRKPDLVPAPATTNRPAANTPAPRLQPAPHMPQDQPAAFHPSAPVEKVPAAPPSSLAPAPPPNAMSAPPLQTAPPAMPPVAMSNKAPSPPTPPELGLSELSRQLKGMPSPESGRARSASPLPASAPAAPSDEAPSRLRSLFGAVGQKWKDVARKSEEIPALSPMPPSAPNTLAPAPANNNQSPTAAPARPNQPAPPPQPASPNPAPIPASLEQLVDHASLAHAGSPSTAPTPSPAPLNQHNRYAKRRRAVPSSLGSNESLSATGSVLEKGRLVEAVPRKMKMNMPSRAEVRITREQLDEINSEFEELSSSHIHELAVTEAMTVQLRAPGSGFHIENLSPQTQWIDRNQRHINDADFGVWRWNVTPVKSGKARLQLVISARTVDDDGNIHIADIPDKIIELSIAKDYGNGLKKLAFIAFLVISSLALGRYGEAAWQWAFSFISKLGS